jgi:hypothetical protein
MITLDKIVSEVEGMVDWVDSKPSVPAALVGFGVGVLLPINVVVYSAVFCAVSYAALMYLKSKDKG